MLGGGVLEARNPLLTGAITRRLGETAPTAAVRIVDAPPVTGAALLGLDYLGAGPAAEALSALATTEGRREARNRSRRIGAG